MNRAIGETMSTISAPTELADSPTASMLELIARGKAEELSHALDRARVALGTIEHGDNSLRSGIASQLIRSTAEASGTVQRVRDGTMTVGWVGCLTFQLGRLAFELDVLTNVVGETPREPEYHGVTSKSLHAAYDEISDERCIILDTRSWLVKYARREMPM